MVRVMINKPQSLTTMSVVTTNGQRISLISSPVNFDYINSATVGTIDRVGKKKISRAVAPGTATLNFQHQISKPDWHASVGDEVNALLELARVGATVRFNGASGLEMSNWWTITGISLSVIQRTPLNQISRAQLRWSLIEANDVVDNRYMSLGTPGILKGQIPMANGSNGASVWDGGEWGRAQTVISTGAVRLYTVMPGDTLFTIAQKFLGSGDRWWDIWGLNQETIGNPNLAEVGYVLKIPAA